MELISIPKTEIRDVMDHTKRVECMLVENYYDLFRSISGIVRMGYPIDTPKTKVWKRISERLGKPYYWSGWEGNVAIWGMMENTGKILLLTNGSCGSSFETTSNNEEWIIEAIQYVLNKLKV